MIQIWKNFIEIYMKIIQKAYDKNISIDDSVRINKPQGSEIKNLTREWLNKYLQVVLF